MTRGGRGGPSGSPPGSPRRNPSLALHVSTAIGAARKALRALVEGRLPLSPASWRRNTLLHWRESNAADPPTAAAGHESNPAARLDATYQDWLRRRGRRPAPSPSNFPFSIVAFLDDVPSADALVASVLQQSATPWRLWLIEPAGGHRDPSRCPLPSFAHPHIHWLSPPDIASAAGTWLPPGDDRWIVFVEAGCVLAPDALGHLAQAVAAGPADWIYTDDDRRGEDGTRRDPSLKGAFSPELALVDDYAVRLAAAPREAVARASGLRLEDEAAQLFGLSLRVTQKDARVRHLAEVCCHRTKPLPDVLSDHHRRAAGRFLAGCAPGARIEICPASEGAPGPRPQVRWGHRPQPVTIVVPSRDRVELLRACLAALGRTVPADVASLIVVDDESQDQESLEYLDELAREGRFDCRVIRHRRPTPEFNYSRLINAGAAAVGTPLMLHLNNDVEALSPGWLEQMAGWFCRPEIGVVGAKLLYPDGRLQHAGVVVPRGGIPEHAFRRRPSSEPGYRWTPHRLRNVSAVTGACLLTSTDLFRRLGGFDEDHFPVQFNDIDYCLRAGATGARIVYEPAATLVHADGASRGRSYDLRENTQFTRIYGAHPDPFVSPHLELLSVVDGRPVLVEADL